MGKSNFNLVVLSTILLFCGSLDAQDREVVEGGDEGNRIYISVRLKFEIWKEMFFSSISLPLKNGKEESSIVHIANADNKQEEDRAIRIPVQDIADESWQKILEGLNQKDRRIVTNNILKAIDNLDPEHSNDQTKLEVKVPAGIYLKGDTVIFRFLGERTTGVVKEVFNNGLLGIDPDGYGYGYIFRKASKVQSIAYGQ